MNRKMRAKLNNQTAKARKEKRCSKADTVLMTDEPDPSCEECGEKLQTARVVGVLVEHAPVPKEKLH